MQQTLEQMKVKLEVFKRLHAAERFPPDKGRLYLEIEDLQEAIDKEVAR